MKKVYIRPFGKPIREPLWLRVVRWLSYVIATTAFAVAVAILLLEWMAGCGETYVDANGVRHQHECVFIPNQKEK